MDPTLPRNSYFLADFSTQASDLSNLHVGTAGLGCPAAQSAPVLARTAAALPFGNLHRGEATHRRNPVAAQKNYP
jgi:hypothetical protein